MINLSPFNCKFSIEVSKIERIMIIGGNGAGKTTFSKLLSAKLNIPLVHLDQLFWKDNWQMSTQEEFREKHLIELKKNSWIIDGNISHSMPERIKYCDTVIYFDFPNYKCLYGVVKRVFQNYGRSRSDMGGYCPERFNYKFMKSTLKFNLRNRKRFYELINSTQGIEVVIIKNHRQAERYLKNI